MKFRPSAEEISKFYKTLIGAVVARSLRREIKKFLSELKNADKADYKILGIGFCNPCLNIFGNAGMVASLMPAAQGADHCSPGGKENISVMADENHIPFPDLSFDIVVVMHGLEFANDMQRFMREIWRILIPEGKVVIIVPNRMSGWSVSDSTPFGHGQPFSVNQLQNFLEQNMFQVTKKKTALFLFRSNLKLLVKLGMIIDNILSNFYFMKGGGVIIMQVRKRLYAGTPSPAAEKLKRLKPQATVK